ncbi:MAG: hypothetical protein NWF06_02290 [Candidatus Bathyarchaeota archaeon]|nr:hypothetical protein [Candidatus Bathyarchaeum sp.]
MVIKQCPKCNHNVSLTQLQWDLGAKLPKDCPWCNKKVTKKEDRTREYYHEESKPTYRPWLKKGA